MDLKVTSITRGTKVVLESEDFTKPVITMKTGWLKDGRSQLTFSCYYNRPSSLFQVIYFYLLKNNVIAFDFGFSVDPWPFAQVFDDATYETLPVHSPLVVAPSTST